MISVFISVGPYTNDRRQLNRESSSITLRCGLGMGSATSSENKMLDFCPRNATFWYILVTIICSHWPIGGALLPCPPLSTPLCRGNVQTTMSHVCSHSNSYNWSNRVRSSLKDALNSIVFICRLNANVRFTSSDRRRQSIPDPRSGHWKCSIAKCSSLCGRHE